MNRDYTIKISIYKKYIYTINTKKNKKLEFDHLS